MSMLRLDISRSTMVISLLLVNALYTILTFAFYVVTIVQFYTFTPLLFFTFVISLITSLQNNNQSLTKRGGWKKIKKVVVFQQSEDR